MTQEPNMDRIHEERRNHRHGRTDAEQVDQAARAETAEDLKHDLDEIVDEIDSVLEQNAEEFVAAYVQKGGQ
jgi:prokaryotic ubiquitin-like protein Pup